MGKETWHSMREREAAEKLASELDKPDAHDEFELGADDTFDPWKIFPAVFGSYSGDFDDCALEVLRELRAGQKMRRDLAAEIFREMLCVSHLCDYGTSPRVCFPTSRFKELLPGLICRWETYRKMKWIDHAHEIPHED